MIVLLLALLLLAAPASAQEAVAFVDVNVLTMTGAAPLQRHTVVVRDGRITHVGPVADVRVPADARVVNGGGTQYLMPGLADMHVHTLHADELPLFLYYGITTVRNLHGTPMHLAWRDSIAAGQRIGPRIYTSGPIIDGDPPTRATNHVVRTAAQADSIVRAQKAAGYDQIKIYDNVSADAYVALIEAARAADMPLVGHVPTPVGLARLIELRGQRAIEHAEELLPFFRGATDTLAIQQAVDGLVDAGVWLDATFSVYLSILDQLQDWESASRAPEIEDVHPDVSTRFGWQRGNGPRGPGAEARVRAQVALMSELVRRYHTSGGRLIIGTDSPMPLVVPGAFLAREMQAHVDAGVPAGDVLRMATRGAAEFMGAADRGTIAPGMHADLILLDANPLHDTAALRAPAGVMAGRRYHTRAELRAMLDSLRAARTP